MAEESQSMGFDFTKDLKDLPRIIALLDKYNLKVQDITKSGIDYNRTGQVQKGVFEAINTLGQKLIITLKGLKNEEGELTGKIGLANYKLQQQTKIMQEAQKAQLQYATAQGQASPFGGNKNAEVASYGLDELDKTIPKQMKETQSAMVALNGETERSIALTRELQAAKIQGEQEYLASIRREVDLHAELDAARTKGEREYLFQKQAEYKLEQETLILSELRQKDLAAELSLARQIAQSKDDREYLFQKQAEYKLEQETLILADLRKKDLAIELSLARQLVQSEEQLTRQKEQQAEIDATNAASLRRSFGGAFGPISQRATTDQRLNYASSLDSSLNFVRNGQVSLQRFQEIFAGVKSGAVDTFSGIELQVAKSIQGAQKTYKELGTVVENTNRGITLSWKSMARLFEIQVLHNVFGLLITQLQQGAKEAIDLQIRIGEIISISQEAPLTFNQWAKGIRELSDLYGKDLKDVAEATYQTISNQVAKGNDALRLMNGILKFSITSVSSVADSASLLTAAMNAYGKKQYEVDEIAASFFKTIELGRVRGDELAESLGRVLPVAAKLGVSLNDVNAAVATLTLAGVKPADAITLLTNVFLKLEKPTKDMSLLFKQWGVEGSDAALAAFGFSGVLKKLEEAANGSSTEMADLFGNLRAIRGALGLTGSAFENFQKNREKISTGEVSYNRGYQAIETTPGKVLSDQLNQLKNLFIIDFGSEAVTKLAAISNSIGGFVKPVRESVLAVSALVKGFLAFQAGGIIAKAIQFTVTNLRGMNVELQRSQLTTGGSLNIIQAQSQELSKTAKAWQVTSNFAASYGLIIATTVAYAVEKQNQLFEEQLHVEEKLRESFGQTAQVLTDERLKAASKYFETLGVANDSLFAALTQASAKTNQSINESLTAQEGYLEEHTAHMRGVLESYAKDVESSLSKIEEQRRKLETSIENSGHILAEVKDEAERTDFRRQLADSTPLEQVELLGQRFKQLRKDMRDLFNNADEQGAKKKYDEALQVLNELSTIDAKYRHQAITLQNELTKSQGSEAVQQRRAELEAQIRLLEAQKSHSPQLAQLRDTLADLNSNTAIEHTAQEIETINGKLKDTQKIIAAILPNTADGLAKSFEGLLASFRDSSLKVLADVSKKALDEQVRTEILKNTISKLDSFDLLDKTGKSKFKTPEEAIKAYDTLLQRAESNGLTEQTAAFKEAWAQRAIIAKEVQTEIYAEESKHQQENLVNLKRQAESLLQDLKGQQEKALTDSEQSRANALSRIGLVGAAGAYKPNGLAAPFNSQLLSEDQDARLSKLSGLIDDSQYFPQSIPNLLKAFQTNKSDASFKAVVNAFKELESITASLHKDGIGTQFLDKTNIELNNVQQSFTQFIEQAHTALTGFEASQKGVQDIGEKVTTTGTKILDLSKQIAGLPTTSGTAIEQTNKDFDLLIGKIKEAQVEMHKLNLTIGGSAQPTLPPYSFTPTAQPTYPQQATTQPGSVTNIGDIHVHAVPVTGNVRVDAKAVATAIKNEMRKGTVSPLPTQEKTHDATWNH